MVDGGWKVGLVLHDNVTKRDRAAAASQGPPAGMLQWLPDSTLELRVYVLVRTEYTMDEMGCAVPPSTPKE